MKNKNNKLILTFKYSEKLKRIEKKIVAILIIII